MKPARHFANDAIMSAVAASFGRGLSLLGLIATTRIFPAETYGTWLLILTFSNFFLPLTTLRMEIPYVMANTQRMVKGLLYGILMCAGVVISAVFIFAAFANKTLVFQATGVGPQQSGLIFLSIPAALLLVCQLMVQSSLMRAKQFHTIAAMNIVVPLVSLLLTVILPLFLPVTPLLAASIYLASIAAGQIIALPFLSTLTGLATSGISRLAIARAAFRRYSVYPKYTLPLSLSASLTERITQLVLAQAYSIETLASFFMARQILNGFTSVIGGSLRNVFFAHGARDSEITGTRERAVRMLKLLTYLLAPLLAFAIFRVEEIVTLIAGTKWPNLAPMAWYCMFPALALIFTGPLDRVFDLVGRQKLSVALQMISDAAMLLSIAIAVHFSASAQTLVSLISAVLIIYNAVWLCFTLNSLATPTIRIAWFFFRFAFVLVLCLVPQWATSEIRPAYASWIASVLFLGLSCVPGFAAFSSSFSFFRSKLGPRLVNSLQRLP